MLDLSKGIKTWPGILLFYLLLARPLVVSDLGPYPILYTIGYRMVHVILSGWV